MSPSSSSSSSHVSRGLSRRQLFGVGGAGSLAVLLGTGAVSSDRSFAARRTEYPFTLGVASGDPGPDGVVLWTRLAPEPLAADGHGGVPDRPIAVDYQVASDEGFRTVVRQGSVVATRALGHSVHPEVAGLLPDRPYWYRFRAGGYLSPVGRTKTTPAAAVVPARLRFAYASCQRWSDGFFTAYDHLAREDLDLVVHLGDYIYEESITRNRRGTGVPGVLRDEANSLPGYRLRYALYKSDPALQRAHAAFPWIQVFDDHEVEDNFAGDHSIDDGGADNKPSVFRRRRARAFQAMYEHLPLRRGQLPSGARMRMHRRIPYGRLADFTILDTRQYRSDQPCGDGISATCKQRFDTDLTMLGAAQKRWLLDGFSRSPGQWQILGNQAPMAQTDLNDSRSKPEVWLDPWDGYVAERNQVLKAARQRGVDNLVAVTGDRHANYVMDLKEDFADMRSPVVGTEFVGTSITSGGDGEDVGADGRTLLAANPHLHFYNGQRGYSRVLVTPTRLTNEFRTLDRVERRGGKVRTRARFVVESGRAGAHRE